jgi:hypothetical protein
MDKPEFTDEGFRTFWDEIIFNKPWSKYRSYGDALLIAKERGYIKKSALYKAREAKEKANEFMDTQRKHFGKSFFSPTITQETFNEICDLYEEALKDK